MRDSPFKKEQDALNERYESGQRNVVFDPLLKKRSFAVGRNALKIGQRALWVLQRARQVREYAVEGLGRAPKLKRYPEAA